MEHTVGEDLLVRVREELSNLHVIMNHSGGCWLGAAGGGAAGAGARGRGWRQQRTAHVACCGGGCCGGCTMLLHRLRRLHLMRPIGSGGVRDPGTERARTLGAAGAGAWGRG